MDLKTKQSVGFAFINMTHALYILDFFLEFNQFRWAEAMPECYSKKTCQIVYANMQGMDEIKAELKDKNVMKKNDKSFTEFANCWASETTTAPLLSVNMLIIRPIIPPTLTAIGMRSVWLF